MSASNLETFSGGTFNFYIGPDKVLFVLYKRLVSRYSEPLKQMMSNGMKESQEGAAPLEHVDVDTFGRFAEYIHSGDYSAASPVEVAPQPEEEHNDTEPMPEESPNVPATGFGTGNFGRQQSPPAPHSGGFGTGNFRTWGSTAQRPRMENKFRGNATFGEDEPKARPLIRPFPVDPSPGPNKSPSTSHVPTLACHISVFHFAQEYLIPGLKELARHKFSETLHGFRCYPSRAADICHVIQLIYNHEDGSSDPQSLHDVVSKYAANNFRVLMSSPHFKRLLSEGGAFPPDVCDKVSELIR